MNFPFDSLYFSFLGERSTSIDFSTEMPVLWFPKSIKVVFTNWYTYVCCVVCTMSGVSGSPKFKNCKIEKI